MYLVFVVKFNQLFYMLENVYNKMLKKFTKFFRCFSAFFFLIFSEDFWSINKVFWVREHFFHSNLNYYSHPCFLLISSFVSRLHLITCLLHPSPSPSSWFSSHYPFSSSHLCYPKMVISFSALSGLILAVPSANLNLTTRFLSSSFLLLAWLPFQLSLFISYLPLRHSVFFLL